jgi:hypothetical protein
MGRDTQWFPWFYEELDKRIWRKMLRETGLKVPAQIAEWDGKTLKILEKKSDDNQLWWDNSKGKKR